MKRKHIYFLFVIILMTSLCGCATIVEKLHLFQSYHESYIARYFNVDFTGEYEVEKSLREYLTYNIWIPNRKYAEQFVEEEPQNEEEKLLQTRHRELSERNGDVGFNRWCNDEYGWRPDGEVWNTDNLISSISIVSNADFDAYHPAGIALDDIVLFCYDTHKPYIDNGYVHPDTSREKTDIRPYRQEVLIADFQSENSLFMCRQGMALKFQNLPTEAKQHTFTVAFKFENNVLYKLTFDAEFADVAN